MLEIKNLTKIYKSKGGVKVKALDDVSTKFPETGMVFLLGKSGSGKSTLLNVCGGLDTPTNGEIIVKGRSSINFKQRDFDSYRNTFIGFIFQEYNILEEFTVEENIALALELQGKEKDQKIINNLLESVDLKGYNTRKPNTLSGGQKQRLAIARALVKNPEIIMADEPTGALDSETGKQVFDTLKELAKDTLVIVVSHDRDFAEKYADRIIELKDGKIISDVTKKSNGFKETKDSDVEIKKYEKKDSEFISSKFPLKHAIKMGLSSLKLKKIRLIMTILLCTIAFTMFGLLSTLLFYKRESTFKETITSSLLPYIQIAKEYEVKETQYYDGEENYVGEYSDYGHFTKDEVKTYITKYGKDTFAAITTDTTFDVHDNSVPYWVNAITTYAYLEESNSNRQNMIGTYPIKDNEIAISSYTASVFINAKVDDYDTGKTLGVKKINDLIGKKIKLKETVYTITGIVDSGKISSKYDTLKLPGKVEDEIFADFKNELQDGLHLVAFVTDNQLEIESRDYSLNYDTFSERTIYLSSLKDGKYDFDLASMGYYASFNQVGKDYDYLNLKNYTNLGESQAIVNYKYFAESVSNVVGIDEATYKLAYSLYIGGEDVQNTNGTITIRKFNQEEIVEKTKKLYDVVKNKNLKLEFGLKLYDPYEGRTTGQTYDFEIVGIFIPEGYSENEIIINDTIYQKLKKYEIDNYENAWYYETNYVDKGYYDIIYVSYDKTEESTNRFWDIRSNNVVDENDSKEVLTGSTIAMLDTVDYIVQDFSQIIFWVGLVLAIFAALLFSNFISVSISNKRKEIGILRAIGAKGIDVFKIFFSESVILSMICVVLSSFGSIIICTKLNDALDIGVSVFVFGVLSFLVVILIAIITSIFATFIPVNSAARKKPIESIRSV